MPRSNSHCLIILSVVLLVAIFATTNWNAADAAECRGSGCCGNGSSCCGTGSGCYRDITHRCGLPVPLYPVPYSTPPVVGHTYFSYPPLMPHHSLHHFPKAYSYRHAPGLSRTNVLWHASYVHSAWNRLHYALRLPR